MDQRVHCESDLLGDVVALKRAVLGANLMALTLDVQQPEHMLSWAGAVMGGVGVGDVAV